MHTEIPPQRNNLLQFLRVSPVVSRRAHYPAALPVNILQFIIIMNWFFSSSSSPRSPRCGSIFRLWSIIIYYWLFAVIVSCTYKKSTWLKRVCASFSRTYPGTWSVVPQRAHLVRRRRRRRRCRRSIHTTNSFIYSIYYEISFIQHLARIPFIQSISMNECLIHSHTHTRSQHTKLHTT